MSRLFEPQLVRFAPGLQNSKSSMISTGPGQHGGRRDGGMEWDHIASTKPFVVTIGGPGGGTCVFARESVYTEVVCVYPARLLRHHQGRNHQQ